MYAKLKIIMEYYANEFKNRIAFFYRIEGSTLFCQYNLSFFFELHDFFPDNHKSWKITSFPRQRQHADFPQEEPEWTFGLNGSHPRWYCFCMICKIEVFVQNDKNFFNKEIFWNYLSLFFLFHNKCSPIDWSSFM